MYAYYIQMLKSISRSINKAMKRFNKSSPWLKALVLLILVLLVSGTTGKCRAIKEGFIQEEKFVSESGLKFDSVIEAKTNSFNSFLNPVFSAIFAK